MPPRRASISPPPANPRSPNSARKSKNISPASANITNGTADAPALKPWLKCANQFDLDAHFAEQHRRSEFGSSRLEKFFKFELTSKFSSAALSHFAQTPA